MRGPGLHARIEAQIGRRSIDVDLTTGPGTLALVGPNGAGKTLVLNLILGVLPMTRGRIAIGDVVLKDTEAAIDVRVERRRLGYVPQDYGLFPHLTVERNVAFALESAAPRMGHAARAAQVAAVLDAFALTPLSARHPRTLSGGEKQRVALARAISVSPRALLLDEPMAALDVHARRRVVTHLSAYLTQLALPTVVVTHDPEEAKLLGHRIAVVEDGQLTQCGTFDELAAAPGSAFVADFVSGARSQPG